MSSALVARAGGAADTQKSCSVFSHGDDADSRATLAFKKCLPKAPDLLKVALRAASAKRFGVRELVTVPRGLDFQTITRLADGTSGLQVTFDCAATLKFDPTLFVIRYIAPAGRMAHIRRAKTWAGGSRPPHSMKARSLPFQRDMLGFHSFAGAVVLAVAGLASGEVLTTNCDSS